MKLDIRVTFATVSLRCVSPCKVDHFWGHINPDSFALFANLESRKKRLFRVFGANKKKS